MFNLGLVELVIIALAGILLFGPGRLPRLARALGKGLHDFKKNFDEGRGLPHAADDKAPLGVIEPAPERHDPRDEKT